MATNEDFFQVLGKISIFFATLDFIVTELFVRLIDRTSVTRIPRITDRTTLGNKLSKLEKLNHGQVIDVELLDRIKDALPDARRISQERNRYTHDQWEFAKNNIRKGRIRRLRIRFDRDMRYRFEPMQLTLENLYAFMREIGALQKRFGAFLSELPPVTH